ncbi:MAG: signal recognition particle-docking protein FtsY [archaeon]
MFGKLKEKLKSWVSKNKPTDEKETLKEKPSIDETIKITEKEIAKEKKKLKKEQIKEAKRLKKETSKEEKKKESEGKTVLETTKETEQEDSLKKVIETEPEEEGFFMKFKKRLTEEMFEEMFEELQIILLQNNVAYEAVESIKESLEEKLVGKTLKEVDIEKELKNAIENLLVNPPNFIEKIKDELKEKSPFIILFAGINGSGKTTTIAKVASLLQKNNLSVCLAAADTFRAASIEQIQQHADKLKIPLIKKDYGSDPASVGFDAIAYAKKHKTDVVLIDTAGRMQNKDSLMKEIEKIARVNKPDMKIFLGESITGNDATEQAKTFNEVIGLTGIILSKADVDESGGTAISVTKATGKPILFLGTGQNYDDLEVFEKDKLIGKLFS